MKPYIYTALILKSLKNNLYETNMRTHKYWAKKTEIDWIKFASQLEARFYKYFKDQNIEILELQPVFTLQEKFIYEKKTIRDIKYIPDFKIKYNWDIYFVDSKGMSEPVFKLKHKLWLKRYWGENILIIAKSIKDLETQIWKNTLKHT